MASTVTTTSAGLGLPALTSTAAFGAALMRPILRSAMRRRIFDEIDALPAYILKDIGVERANIRQIAREMADQRYPRRRLGSGNIVRAGRSIFHSIKRAHQRRNAIASLMALDDRMLKDIGTSRSMIEVVVDPLKNSDDAPRRHSTSRGVKVDDVLITLGQALAVAAGPANDNLRAKAS